jgi:hypothetical protein
MLRGEDAKRLSGARFQQHEPVVPDPLDRRNIELSAWRARNASRASSSPGWSVLNVGDRVTGGGA